jgi:hypothetical protein
MRSKPTVDPAVDSPEITATSRRSPCLLRTGDRDPAGAVRCDALGIQRARWSPPRPPMRGRHWRPRPRDDSGRPKWRVPVGPASRDTLSIEFRASEGARRSGMRRRSRASQEPRCCQSSSLQARAIPSEIPNWRDTRCKMAQKHKREKPHGPQFWRPCGFYFLQLATLVTPETAPSGQLSSTCGASRNRPRAPSGRSG